MAGAPRATLQVAAAPPAVAGPELAAAAPPPVAELDLAPAALPVAELDFAAAARAVLVQLQERSGLDTCLVTRRQGDSLIVLDAVGEGYAIAAGDVLEWDTTFCARMLAGDGPRVAPVVADVPIYVETAVGLDMDVGALVSVPIPDGSGGALGTVCGFDPQPKDGRLADQQPLLELWAELLGALLTRELRLEQEVRRAEHAELAAGLDPLTGAGNRRLWDRATVSEEARCRRYGIAAAVLVVDLDALKAINDRDGHQVGDALLRRTAACLRDTARSGDTVARLGGDEFAILAVECDAAGAEELAVRVRAALAATDSTASVGVGLRAADGDLSAAWEAADAEMYAAKRQRRRDTRAGPGSPPRPASAPRIRRASTDPAIEGAETIDQLLRAAREHLDMDVAIIGELVGGRYVFRHVNSLAPVDFRPGQVKDADATYCQRVLDGRLPGVMNDTQAHREGVAVEARHHLGLRSYVGVPITFSDGRAFGIMCSAGAEPKRTLDGRDADFLQVMARVTSDVLEREHGESCRRHAIVDRLDRTLGSAGLVAVYQPIVALAGGEVVGVEALSRFPADPARPVQDWFAEASAVGAGVDLELAAARQSLLALEAIDGFMAINFSAETLLTPAAARLLHELPLERIVIEISEHEAIADYGPLTERLAPLRAAGLRLAVDDAGAGFASFGHILSLRPDVIKLDISLIRRIVSDPDRQALAAALTGFGHQAGARVVAEGIEAEAELAILRDLGVDWGQGFHLGRPAPQPALRRP